MSSLTETLAAFILLGQRLNTTSEYIGLILITSGLFFMYR